jgi:hypothetical protein
MTFKIEKDKIKEEVIAEVTSQLNLIEDPELAEKVNSYRIEPILHLAIWSYSENQAKYPVWLVLSSEKDDTGILFSEYGFDFGNWGLIQLSSRPIHFGSDFQWYPSLKDAFLESCMAE